jgi:cytochrome b
MIGVTVLLVVELIVPNSRAYSAVSAVALAVFAAIGALAIGLVTAGTLRMARWSRSAAIVWQIVQAFVGLQALQGVGARPDLGALLIVPAVVALVLLFRRDVAEATRRG